MGQISSRTLRRALHGLVALSVAACGGTAPITTLGTAPTTTPTTAAPTTTTSVDRYEGASLVADGCDYGGNIRSIEATDEHIVAFVLCGPDAAFLAKSALVAFGIQPAEHLEATAGAPLRNPVGTGPYRLAQWVNGESITFERNERYYGEPAPQARVVLRWGPEEQRLRELEAGTVDGITLSQASDYHEIDDDPDTILVNKPEPDVLYMAMTNTFEPFDNPDVRKALAMGIDRQDLVERFYPPGSEVASYFTPCSVQNGCRGASWYDYDPTAARGLLEAAGYGDGFSTRIYYRDLSRGYLPQPDALAFELSQQLHDNLNIDAEVVEMESRAFIEASSAGDLDGIYLLGWTGAYPHVTHFLDDRFEADNPQFGRQDPSYTEPLSIAATTATPEVAAELYAEANSAIKDFVPMVPIVHSASAFAYRATVAGAYAPPWGELRFNHMDNGGETFVFMQDTEPASLYCADEADHDSFRACAQVIEGLYSYSPGGTLRPQLATACTPDDQLVTWVCELRRDVIFHDGTAFDANDVVASWAAGLDAANPDHTGNTGAWTYYRGVWGGLMNDEG
jgi:peptide/nickel transport system substrate-binding protein